VFLTSLKNRLKYTLYIKCIHRLASICST